MTSFKGVKIATRTYFRIWETRWYVKDMESPPRTQIELPISLWLVAFGHLGGPLGPMACGLWPPNLALQAPWLVVFSKPSNFSIESFTERLMKIWLNLAEVLSIHKLFFCLLFESSWDTHSKIFWKFHIGLTRFG